MASERNISEPCRFWLRGGCSFGDRCRQSHSPSTAFTGYRSKEACKFFQMGTCKNGDRCQFTHTIGNRNPVNKPVAKPNLLVVCKYYREGRCTNAVCPFEHVSDKTSSVWRTKSSQSPVASTSPRPLPDSKDSTFRVAFGPTIPCKYFQQGRCTNARCTFLHSGEQTQTMVQREEQQWTSHPTRDNTKADDLDLPKESTQFSTVRQDPDTELNPTLTRYGCKVEFGPGASIHFITTAFESRTIVVSNIPPDTSQDSLMEVLEHFGHIKSIKIDPAAAAAGTARVEFIEPSQAASAVENLTDYEFGASAILAARFDLTAIETGPAILRSTKVKLTWYAPSIIAWAHYNTVTKARKEAERLNGMVFSGCKLGAKFQAPNFRQTTSFSIVILGLPAMGHATWSKEQLGSFAHAASITVGNPSYRQEEAFNQLRVLLLESGDLESFEAMPTNGRKITAWAQFASSDAATAAVAKLHNATPSCLGGKIQLWMEHIHSFKYTLPSMQFRALKDRLDQLRATAEMGSQLRYYDKDELGVSVDPVCVRLYGSDPKVLGKMKVALERELQGTRLDNSDGVGVWDEFFLTPPGEAFIQSLHSETQAYVKCDARSRSIRLYGSEASLQYAKSMMESKLEERQIVVLDKDALRTLVAGGFEILQDQFSAEKLVLNIVSQTISVTGDEGDAAKVRRALEQLKLGAVDEVDESDESSCPVCFCTATEPITLPCGHIYDTLCLGHLIRSAITSDFVSVRCVKELEEGQTCSVQVPHAVIRGLLNGDEEAHLLEASLRGYIHTRPHEFHYCPTPDCPTVYRPRRAGTVLRCPNCMERFCPSCHVQYHEGLSCEEYKDGMSENSQLFQKWKEENGVKSCPKCNADIQKNGGCNHITCAGCKTHICWVCMETFSNDDSSGGVYPHMNRAHGGFGRYYGDGGYGDGDYGDGDY